MMDHDGAFSLSGKDGLSFWEGPDNQKVEFIDSLDRPLLVALPGEGRRLGLACRMVCVILYDARQRVYVRRRPADAAVLPRCWDVSAQGGVLAGEAREDAARRQLTVLTPTLPTQALPLVKATVLPPQRGDRRYHLTLFRAGPVPCVWTLPDPGQGLFLDRDELRGLAVHAPELLTPLLLWAIETEILWRCKV